jgi:hypothetical protein
MGVEGLAIESVLVVVCGNVAIWDRKCVGRLLCLRVRWFAG